MSYTVVENIGLDGERLPVLLAPDGGVPFLPAYYVASICRPRDSSSTITIKLNNIKFLYEWTKICGFDLERRFESSEMLSSREIDSLVYVCRLRMKSLKAEYTYASNTVSPKDVGIVRIGEQPPKLGDSSEIFVNHSTQARRLDSIAKYLQWMSFELMKNLDRANPEYENRVEATNRVIGWIRHRIPRHMARSQSRLSPPRGFEKEVQDIILDLVESANVNNPWKNKFVRIRNQLYITMCVMLGLRMGESLSLKLEDVYLMGDRPRIDIVRRPDDPDESRIPAPKVKTLERSLALGSSWVKLLPLYLKYRRRLRGAKKHPYLFVSRTGTPLAYSSACKIFTTLRDKHSQLPNDLTQHVIRHAWNERFSEYADASGVSADDVREIRREAMGWSVSSVMPEKYNQRFIQRKTDEISVLMQEQMLEDWPT
nr:site-specific integrase [Pseudodesulfovibrio sp.]